MASPTPSSKTPTNVSIEEIIRVSDSSASGSTLVDKANKKMKGKAARKPPRLTDSKIGKGKKSETWYYFILDKKRHIATFKPCRKEMIVTGNRASESSYLNTH